MFKNIEDMRKGKRFRGSNVLDLASMDVMEIIDRNERRFKEMAEKSI